MLKQRILTALILIPIFVGLVLKLPSLSFCILTGVIVLLCAWEWSFLMGVKRYPQVFLYPKMSRTWGKGVVLRGVMGFLVLIPCWLAVNFIRNVENGPYILLFLL